MTHLYRSFWSFSGVRSRSFLARLRLTLSLKQCLIDKCAGPKLRPIALSSLRPEAGVPCLVSGGSQDLSSTEARSWLSERLV